MAAAPCSDFRPDRCRVDEPPDREPRVRSLIIPQEVNRENRLACLRVAHRGMQLPRGRCTIRESSCGLDEGVARADGERGV